VEYVKGGANLVSENVLLEKHNLSIQKQGTKVTYYKGNEPVMTATVKNRLQILDFRPSQPASRRSLMWSLMAVTAEITDHERLAHINCQFLKKTAEKGAAWGLRKAKLTDIKCLVCMKAKATRVPFPSTENQEH